VGGEGVISLVTALPVLGAVLLFPIGGRNAPAARWIALGFSLAVLALTLGMWVHFDAGVAGAGGMQFEERHAWVPTLGVEYRVGVDGLGILMMLLTAVVTPMGIAGSWRIEERVGLYFALVLLLEACMIGSFTALNFFHWFLYWELGLIPAFFLIKSWGGRRATAAATQFLVYTMVGSVALLLAFLAIFVAAKTFDFAELAGLAQRGQLMPAVVSALGWHRFAPEQVAMILFAGAFLGFAVKVPLIPFHTWLPAAYAEAPTGTTILLTGAMSKMGVYGFLRILLPIFGPQVRAARTPLLWMAVATIVLGAYAALAQKDLKRMFAYSSVNHLGYAMLAIFAAMRATGGDAGMETQKIAAMNGAMLQMFNHGLTAAAVFWCIALLERRSCGLRGVGDFGGLRKPMPVFAGLMGIALFSSLGLPGLNGFVGEFLIFKGSFPLAAWATSLAVLGLLATAIFILGAIQRVFSGPLNERWIAMPDLSTGERVALAPAIGLLFLLGLYPQLVLGTINRTAMTMVEHLRF
jgi:NADH-quinone oxidoreductase subunit M